MQMPQLSKENQPWINEIVSKVIYVDGCLSGEKSKKETIKHADEF